MIDDLELRGRVDIESVAKTLGLLVCTVDFAGSKVQEITIGNRIGVRSTLSRPRRRWAIAHGVGHALMHRHGNHVWLQTDSRRHFYDRYEREAEEFAHELMVGHFRAPFDGIYENAELAYLYDVPIDKINPHPIGSFL